VAKRKREKNLVFPRASFWTLVASSVHNSREPGRGGLRTQGGGGRELKGNGPWNPEQRRPPNIRGPEEDKKGKIKKDLKIKKQPR